MKFTKLTSIIFLATVLTSCVFRVQFPTDNSINIEEFIPNFLAILGNDWTQDIDISSASNDLAGRIYSLTYRGDVQFYHQKNNFSSLTYTVIFYDHPSSALERYRLQSDNVFFNDSRDSLDTWWSDTQQFNVVNADRNRIACKDYNTERFGRTYQCSGIFLSENIIIYLRAIPSNRGTEYFSDEIVLDIFQAIDDLLGKL